MKTEVKPRIKSGFFINEVELTRIKDAQNEQVKKKSSGVDADFKFEVKYKNGVMHSPLSLSEILSDENDGSKKIIRIVMVASLPSDPSTRIAIRFSDISDTNNSDDIPIAYEVVSDDKDWTFVTSSVIDERVNKIKLSKPINWLVTNKLIPFIASLVPLLAMIFSLNNMGKASVKKVEQIRHIRQTAKSMYDYMYQVDIVANSPAPSVDNLPIYMIGAVLSSFLLSWIARVIVAWYPAYTMYWGDGTKKYDKKIGLIKFVLVGIVFAIILGMVGNYFYDRVFK